MWGALFAFVDRQDLDRILDIGGHPALVEPQFLRNSRNPLTSDERVEHQGTRWPGRPPSIYL
jgi:hypothetical protein